MTHYPEKYLYHYPNFMVSKTNIYNSDTKKLFLENYLDKMPKQKNRTRRNIRDFMMLDNIEIKDIMYVGW